MIGKPPKPAAGQIAPVPALPAEEWTRRLFALARPDCALETARALAASIQRTLAVSRALADAGRAIDLGGLDQWVGRLTAAVIDLEPCDGRRLLPELAGLLETLDEIAARLGCVATGPGGPKPLQ